MSLEWARDPMSVVHDTIKKGIRVTLEHECIASALILIYSGIDAMAFLDMPEKKEPEEVCGADFVAWVDKWLRLRGDVQLTGEELWGARCGVVHCLGVESRATRHKTKPCRKIGYMWKSNCPAVRKAHSDMVFVDVDALAEAFFSGIDKFIVALFAARPTLAEKRFRKMIRAYPFKELIEDLETGQHPAGG